jgi:hydroxyacylglutathione hydrolase
MAAKLIHEIIPVGLLQCNCSILGDPESHEAIVIDPGDEVERILEILKRHGLKVRAIVSTHTHIDHVGGLAALHRATGAPVLIHQDDMELYRAVDVQAEWIGIPAPEVIRSPEFVKEGDRLRWGDFAAEVLHTPGHTPGSISLLVGSADAAGHSSGDRVAAPTHIHAPEASRLIAGDTLFQGSIGRTDFPGGSYPQIISSIREKLLVLPDETLVIPGHGGKTTIGRERASNPFLV